MHRRKRLYKFGLPSKVHRWFDIGYAAFSVTTKDTKQASLNTTVSQHPDQRMLCFFRFTSHAVYTQWQSSVSGAAQRSPLVH